MAKGSMINLCALGCPPPRYIKEPRGSLAGPCRARQEEERKEEREKEGEGGKEERAPTP